VIDFIDRVTSSNLVGDATLFNALTPKKITDKSQTGTARGGRPFFVH